MIGDKELIKYYNSQMPQELKDLKCGMEIILRWKMDNASIVKTTITSIHPNGTTCAIRININDFTFAKVVSLVYDVKTDSWTIGLYKKDGKFIYRDIDVAII